MTSPNGNGTMQLTTQDANGKTKTYDVNFGTAGSTSAAAVKGAQQVAPGANGVAVVHDGNTTITAQQESGGRVKVTVDDGSGAPTTYTLGASSPSAAGTPAMPRSMFQPVADTAPGSAIPTAGAPTTGLSAADVAAGVGSGATAPAGYPAVGAPSPATGLQSTPFASPTPAGGTGAVGGGMGGASSVGGGPAVSGQAVGQSGGHNIFDRQAAVGAPGTPATNAMPVGQPSGVGPASGPPNALHQGDQAQGGASMGGMGGGRSAGQGGGEQEHRVTSQWRTRGRLFDSEDDKMITQFSGTIDDRL